MRGGSRNLARVLLVTGAVAWLLAGSLPVADTASAAFPGGNGAIAYTCTISGVAHDICTINADGTGRAQLTSGGRDFGAVWSADGNRIAFECADGICVMNADGSDLTQLVNIGAMPAWSPDGARIAFVCGGICVMDADGSNRTQLTSGNDAFPSWSPDGTTIAFTRAITAVERDIYVISDDGSGLTPLTNGPSHDFRPDWSPDGTKIAFSRDFDDGDGEIYVMNLDGSDVTRLTFSGGNGYPAWSPDGTTIAFEHDPQPGSGGGDVYVMNADGSAVTALTTGGDALWPDWQPLTGPPPFSDLVLRMAGPRHIGPGDPITYTIHVRNDGPSRADGVVVTDPLPAGTQFIRAFTGRGSCSAPDPASGALVCSLGSMGDGSHRTIIVVCRAAVGAGATLTNVATVSSLSRDPNQHDNSATIVTRVGR